MRVDHASAASSPASPTSPGSRRGHGRQTGLASFYKSVPTLGCARLTALYIPKAGLHMHGVEFSQHAQLGALGRASTLRASQAEEYEAVWESAIRPPPAARCLCRNACRCAGTLKCLNCKRSIPYKGEPPGPGLCEDCSQLDGVRAYWHSALMRQSKVCSVWPCHIAPMHMYSLCTSCLACEDAVHHCPYALCRRLCCRTRVARQKDICLMAGTH